MPSRSLIAVSAVCAQKHKVVSSLIFISFFSSLCNANCDVATDFIDYIRNNKRFLFQFWWCVCVCVLRRVCCMFLLFCFLSEKVFYTLPTPLVVCSDVVSHHKIHSRATVVCRRVELELRYADMRHDTISLNYYYAQCDRAYTTIIFECK